MFYGGKCSLWLAYYTQKNWCSYLLCFMRYEGREVPKSNISLFPRKQSIFSKNSIRTKIFFVKYSTKVVSIKFFSTLTVTKLQSFKCGVSENIMVYACPIYRVVYFKLHHCNSPYGAEEGCTSNRLVILLSWNILTRTTEVMSENKLGKMCDVMWMVSRIVKNTIILSFVSIRWKILINVFKQFWKCPEWTCLIKNWKIKKKWSFWEYLVSILW